MPVSFSFSSPPIRCSRPGVPGIAHGRARVSASRLYGRKPPSPSLGVVANSVEMSLRAPTSGMSHGSEPFARYASDRRKTGVRYLIAIRAASIAASKHPAGVEAATTGTGRLGVPPEHHHQEIRLLRLGRHARGGPRPLHVDDDQWQLECHREPDRLRLEHDARPGRGRDTQRAAERSPQRSTRGRDLVFGLERANAEVLHARELLENVRRRRDRVRTQEQRKPGELARSDQPVGQSRVPGDLAIRARLELRRRDLVRDREVLGGLAVVPAGLERAACSPRRSPAAWRTSFR